jgi:protocatechuate 3,4-dioxygenase beta subunit
MMRARVVVAGCLVSVVAMPGIAGQRTGGPPSELRRGNVLFGQVLDAGSDAPVAGAVVTVGAVDAFGRSTADLPRSMVEPGAARPQRVLTNGAGYFLFRDLVPGRYAVSAQAFGYVERNYPLRLVELSAGDKPASVSVRIAKHAAISGAVIDERGEPVAGAPVTALSRELIGGKLVLHSTGVQAISDDRGVYRLPNLLPGGYVVAMISSSTTLPAGLATAIDGMVLDRDAAVDLRGTLILGGVVSRDGEGLRTGALVLKQTGTLPPPPGRDGRMLTYVTAFHPGVSTPADATLITVRSGEQRAGVDLPLRLAAAVRVTGVATGPDGPMPALAIHLVPDSASETDSIDPLGVTTAVTDPAGAFTFLAVAPGRYLLKSTRFTGEVPEKGDATLWEGQALTIGDSDVSGLAVRMKPGIAISGRFEFKSSAGTAPPMPARTRVLLRPPGAGIWRTSIAVVDTDWTFRSSGDPPGRYFVTGAVVPGWSLQSISRGGRVIADDVIELEDGEVSGLVLTFSDRSTRISGSVLEARNSATFDTDVIIFPADTTLWKEGMFNSRRVRLAHTTSAGSFDFADLAPGEYYIAAVSARFTDGWQNPAFLDQLIAGAMKVAIGEAEQRTIDLKTFTPRER